MGAERKAKLEWGYQYGEVKGEWRPDPKRGRSNAGPRYTLAQRNYE